MCHVWRLEHLRVSRMKVRTLACHVWRLEHLRVSRIKVRKCQLWRQEQVYVPIRNCQHTHMAYISHVNYNFHKQTTFHIILLHIIFDQILVCKLFILHFIIFKCINYVMTLNVSSPYIIWLSWLLYNVELCNICAS